MALKIQPYLFRTLLAPTEDETHKEPYWSKPIPYDEFAKATQANMQPAMLTDNRVLMTLVSHRTDPIQRGQHNTILLQRLYRQLKINPEEINRITAYRITSNYLTKKKVRIPTLWQARSLEAQPDKTAARKAHKTVLANLLTERAFAIHTSKRSIYVQPPYPAHIARLNFDAEALKVYTEEGKDKLVSHPTLLPPSIVIATVQHWWYPQDEDEDDD